MNEEDNLWDEIMDDELHKQIYNVGFQKGKDEQKKLREKIRFIELEMRKIVPAITKDIDSIWEIENKYKLKHKKTIDKIRSVRFALRSLDERISYQIRLLLRLKDEGIIKEQLQKEIGGDLEELKSKIGGEDD